MRTSKNVIEKERATLKITTVNRGSTAVMEISGRIDVYTASSVGEAIQSLIVEGASNVILDITSVTRVDSSGVGTLVGNAKSIGSLGGVLCLVGPSEGIRRMLRITNLAEYFRIHDRVDEALDELEVCAAGPAPSWAGGN
jgi:anti-sigma B factor antagonist